MTGSLKRQIWDMDSHIGRRGNKDHGLSDTLKQVAGDLLPPARQPGLPGRCCCLSQNDSLLPCFFVIRLRVTGEGSQIG